MNKNTLFNRVFGEVHYVDKLVVVGKISGHTVYRVYPVETMKIYTRHSYDIKDMKAILKTPCMMDDITFESNTFYCADKDIVFEDDLHKATFNTNVSYMYNKLMNKSRIFYDDCTGLIDFKNLMRNYNFVIMNMVLDYEDAMYYAEVNNIITNDEYKYSKENKI